MSLCLAFALAYVVRFATGFTIFKDAPAKLDFYVSVVIWAVPIWIGVFALCHAYDYRGLFAGFREYTQTAIGCAVGVLAIIVISFFYDLESMARAWLVMVLLFSILFVWSSRFVARRVIWRVRSRGYLRRPTVILGANAEGRALAEQIARDRSSGAYVVGFVDQGASGSPKEIDDLPVLGRLADLGWLIETHVLEDIVIATTALSRQDLLDVYRQYGHDERVELRMSSGLFEVLTTGVRVQELGGVALMSLQRYRITGIDAFLKATLDLVGATLGVILLSPVLLAVAVAVRLDAPGPILFRRRILGLNRREFDAFKFRTMIPDRRKRSLPLAIPDRRASDKTESDPRVTRIGRFLRRTSLDELPQLFNVLRGEMSLVGPRMISPSEIERFGKWQLNLVTVKPGITGPWQVRGRAAIPYEERIKLNMEYIRNYSIWLDLEILLRTVPAVLRGSGAY